MTISADKLNEQKSYDSWAEKKKAKLIPGMKGLFLPLFPPKEGFCVIPAYCTEIPDPKQRWAEVLTPSLARTALQLVPVQLYLQSTALSGGSTGSVPRRRCVKQPFALFPSTLCAPIASHTAQAFCLLTPLPEEGFGGKWSALVSMFFSCTIL